MYVYVNFELLVNEKFAAYGTIIKVFATLKSPYAKACYLILKLEPAIERLHLPHCFGTKCFFIIWLTEDMETLENKCPKCNTFFLLRMGH